MNSDTITLLANIALTLSFIIGLVFGIAQVQASSRDRRERLTLETLKHYQTKEFAELIYYMNYVGMPPTSQALQALPVKEQINIIQFAQEMESLGLLVAERLINIDLVDKTLGSLVTTSWQKYKPVYTEIRKNYPDPFLAEYFQWLAERIDKRMQENPRLPFFESHAPSGTR